MGKAAVSVLDMAGTYPLRSTLEARALAGVSLLAGCVMVFLLYRAFACLDRPQGERLHAPWSRGLNPIAIGAAMLTMGCPLIWYLAARPMSDLPGLAFAVGAQACLLLAWWRQSPSPDGDRRLAPPILAASGQMIVAGACLAGLAVGSRVQTAILTVPLLLLVLIDRLGRGVAGALVGSTLTFSIGGLAWGIPLLVASGGLDAYLAALGTQAAEDFAGVEMLYLDPGNVRLAAFGAIHTFADPWDSAPLAAAVLVLASVGAIALAMRDRRTLAAVMAMAGPYAVYHLLLQDTTFIRYAAPVVPAIAFLAIRGVSSLSPRATLPAGLALTAWSLTVAVPVLAAYGREIAPSPAAVAAMNAAWDPARPVPLAMHQTYQRPLEAEQVAPSPQLPSPPRREWLELVRHWKSGATGPIWFLADPRRTDLALVDPRSRAEAVDFLWSPASRAAFGGSRPASARWIRMREPGWFAEEGWALTPETAGIADQTKRGPQAGPITAWVRRRSEAARILIGGRNLSPQGPSVTFELSLDKTPVSAWEVTPGFFVRVIDLEPGRLVGDGPLAMLTVRSTPTNGSAMVDTAVEQFDLQDASETMWAYDEGWHEAESTPSLGTWRWTSGRAALRILGPPVPVQVRLRVESPRRYFGLPVRARAVAGGREIAAATLGASGAQGIGALEEWRFRVTADELAGADGRVMLETDHTFVPAERGGPDRRRLGLRVFGVTVEPVP
jgi:hypothetical protein